MAYDTRVMGTQARVQLVTADSTASRACADAAHDAFRHVDSLMSNWKDTSEVSRVNREAHPGPVTVDPEVVSVLEAAMNIGIESHGAFDLTVEPLVRAWGFLGGEPRVPEADALEAACRSVGWSHISFDAAARTVSFDGPDVRIDLGGIAKGYGVDLGVTALRACGVTDALVDISGNMYALGSPAGRDAWAVGVRDPRDRMPFMARVELSGRAVATSGIYEQFVDHEGKRYGHILDPRSGSPAEGLISVTVFAPDAMTADGWSTALFVLGPETARQTAARHDELDVILIEPGSTDGAGGERDIVWVERSLQGAFSLIEDAAPYFHVRGF